MSHFSAEALVRRYYEEALSQADWSALDAIVSEDFAEHEIVPGIPPTREGLKQKYDLLRTGCPDLRFSVEDLFSAGERVAVRVTVRGSNTGAFMGRAPSGRSFEASTVGIFRVAGARIVEHWGVFDQLAMIGQLGLKG
jgi:predicted ester cyclase